jgi:hypothetical protein
MKPTSILITNDLAAYGQAEIAKTELVIAITDDGKFFTIGKNRRGYTSIGGLGLPISLLPKVIENPEGMVAVDWK